MGGLRRQCNYSEGDRCYYYPQECLFLLHDRVYPPNLIIIFNFDNKPSSQ